MILQKKMLKILWKAKMSSLNILNEDDTQRQPITGIGKRCSPFLEQHNEKIKKQKQTGICCYN